MLLLPPRTLTGCLRSWHPSTLSLWSGLKRRLGFFRRTRRIKATNTRSRSCAELRLEMGSTAFGRGEFGFATMWRGREVVLLYCGLGREDTY